MEKIRIGLHSTVEWLGHRDVKTSVTLSLQVSPAFEMDTISRQIKQMACVSLMVYKLILSAWMLILITDVGLQPAVQLERRLYGEGVVDFGPVKTTIARAEYFQVCW